MSDTNNDPAMEAYKTELKKFMEKSQDGFEKQLSFISAGTFGITIAFMEKVVGDLKKTNYSHLLIIGWVCLGATFIINLFSHVAAGRAYYKIIEEMDKKEYSQLRATKRIGKIFSLNIGSIVCLLMGISIILIFISLNI